jgi:nitrite reductase/ring-hydroxylating ferredoxin subunit
LHLQLLAMKNTKLYPYPNGWYAVAFSKDLNAGKILSFLFMGKEVVLFRTQKGEAALMDAYCPHLGAHLGKGGTIEGETIRCPFHGFKFNTEGTCTETGYGTKPSPKCKAFSYALQEKNHVILAYYHHDNEAPNWEVPPTDWVDWTSLATHTFELTSHPQETSENSVDIGHFSIVHGYSSVDIIEDLRTEGPYLTSTYTMQRSAGFLGSGKMLTAIFKVQVHGLGYSFVETQVPTFNLQTRHLILSTPIDGEKVFLRVATAINKKLSPSKINVLLTFFPKTPLAYLIRNATMQGFKHDVGQDFDIWQNKIYVAPPPLSKGDGPVAQYRVWAKQFYPNATELVTAD